MKVLQHEVRQRKIEGNTLLDALLERGKLKNDAALCRLLQIAPPRVSKIRHGRILPSSDFLLRIHEVFNIPMIEIRQLLASAKYTELISANRKLE